MAFTLQDIENDERFKNLQSEDKAVVRSQYAKDYQQRRPSLGAIQKTPEYQNLDEQGKQVVQQRYKEDAPGSALKDVGITAKKGLVSLGEAAVGLADIATPGDLPGALRSGIGYAPREVQEKLSRQYTKKRQEDIQRLEETKGFGANVKEYLSTPSSVGHAALETIPYMIGAQGIAKSVMRLAPKLAKTKVGRAILTGFGEGTISAGATASGIRQETGKLDASQKAKAVASGAGTGIIGAVGNRIADKLGLIDADALFLGLGKTRGNILSNIVKGGITEGVFEELPQSGQEQIWMNSATDRPLMEGVTKAMASGLVVGAAVGGGVNLASSAFRKPSGPVGKAADAVEVPYQTKVDRQEVDESKKTEEEFAQQIENSKLDRSIANKSPENYTEAEKKRVAEIQAKAEQPTPVVPEDVGPVEEAAATVEQPTEDHSFDDMSLSEQIALWNKANAKRNKGEPLSEREAAFLKMSDEESAERVAKKDARKKPVQKAIKDMSLEEKTTFINETIAKRDKGEPLNEQETAYIGRLDKLMSERKAREKVDAKEKEKPQPSDVQKTDKPTKEGQTPEQAEVGRLPEEVETVPEKLSKAVGKEPDKPVSKKELLDSKSADLNRLNSEVDKYQEEIDARHDELDANGIKFEDHEKDSTIGKLYTERIKRDTEAATAAYDGARRIVEDAIGTAENTTIYTSIDGMLREHYSLEPSPITGSYMMSKYTGDAIGKDRTIKGMTQNIAQVLLAQRNPSADFFATMESPASGLTPKGKKGLLKEAHSIAQDIDGQIKAFLLGGKTDMAASEQGKQAKSDLPSVETETGPSKGDPSLSTKEPWQKSDLSTSPNIHIDRIKAKRQPDGTYKVVYRGTDNEVFEGESFRSAPAARSFFKEQKIKAQEATGKDSAPKAKVKGEQAQRDNVYATALKLAGGKPGVRVYLSDIKEAHPELSKPEFDKLLQRIESDGDAVLMRLDYGRDITPAVKASAINVSGSPRHILHIVGEEQKAAEARYEKKRKAAGKKEKVKRSVAKGKTEGTTVAKVHQALKNFLRPKGYRNITKAGKTEIVQSQKEIPELAEEILSKDGTRLHGYYNPANGKITLIADNILPGELNGVIRHELLHRLAGSDKAFKKEILGAFNQHRGKDAKVDAAFKRAIDAEGKNASPETISEESLAYYLSEEANRSESLYKTIMAKFRAWLRRNFGNAFVKQLTPSDIREIAIQSIRKFERDGGTTKKPLEKQAQDKVQLAKEDLKDDRIRRSKEISGQESRRKPKSGESAATPTESPRRITAEEFKAKAYREKFKGSITADKNGVVKKFVYLSSDTFGSKNTPEYFTFDLDKLGSNTGNPLSGLGFYFGDNKENARIHSRTGRTFRVALDLKNPIIMLNTTNAKVDKIAKEGVYLESGETVYPPGYTSRTLKPGEKPTGPRYEKSKDFLGGIKIKDATSAQKDEAFLRAKAYRTRMEADGHDGIWKPEWGHYVVFNPDSIVSAEYHTGQFSKNGNRDIRGVLRTADTQEAQPPGIRYSRSRSGLDESDPAIRYSIASGVTNTVRSITGVSRNLQEMGLPREWEKIVNKDFRWFHNLLNPQMIKEKFRSINHAKNVYDNALNTKQDTFLGLIDNLNEDNEMANLSKPEYKAMGEVFVELDRVGKELYGKEKDVKPNEVGPEAKKKIDKIARKNGVDSDKLNRIYQRWLSTNIQSRTHIYASLLRRFPKAKNEIDKLRKETGELKYYYPRKREEGNTVAVVKDGGDTVHVEFFNTTQTGRSPKATSVRNRLRKMYPGKDITIARKSDNTALFNKYMPEVNTELFAHLQKAAVEKLKGVDPKVQKTILDSLNEEVSNLYKAQGFMSSGIKRRDDYVKGFEEERWRDILHQHLAGVAGFVAKTDMMDGFTEAMKMIPKENSGEFRAVDNYTRYLLSNETKADRIANKIRGVLFLKHIAGKLSTPLINLSQVPQATLPDIWAQTGDFKLALKSIRQAYPKVARLLKLTPNKSLHEKINTPQDYLTTEEQEFLKWVYQNGIQQAIMTKEFMGLNQGTLQSGTDKAMDLLGTPFAISETYNRMTSALAAFNAFRGSGVPVEEAKLMARETVNRTQFDYTKGNQPFWVMGRSGWQSTGRVATTFRGYTMGMMGLWYDWLDKGQYQQVLTSMGVLGSVGGISAMPVMGFILAAVRKGSGDDPEKWLEENLGKAATYGIPAGLGLADMSAQVSFGVPFFNEFNRGQSLPEHVFNEIFGASAKLVSDSILAGKYVARGEYWKAAEKGIPIAPVRNVMQGIRTANEGATTYSGKLRVDDSGKVVAFNTYEAVLKGAGFSPTRWAEYWRKDSAERETRAHFENKKKQIYKELRTAKIAKDSSKLKSIRKKIIQYNRDVLGSRNNPRGLVITKASYKSVLRSLRRRPKSSGSKVKRRELIL
jgi:hypothetical protein